jgi:hypothetical protein
VLRAIPDQEVRVPTNPFSTELSKQLAVFGLRAATRHKSAMPPQRIPLGLISGNRQFNCELTPYQRGVAIGMTFKGAKSSEIEVTLDCSCGALRSIPKFAQLRDEGQSQTRTGAPESYTDTDKRNLLRHIRKNPKDSYAKAQKACGMKCSKSTIKRILVKHGIS